MFITCADSRIDPHLTTQTKPGDMFICRNAGNIVPPHSHTAKDMSASIEYAVTVLGVKDYDIASGGVRCSHPEKRDYQPISQH